MIDTSIEEERESLENLDQTLARLIAHDLEIDPSEVTTEFIHEYREKKIYPKMRVDFTNRYGGLNPRSAKYFVGDSVSELRAFGERFMSQFNGR
jgi:hypothetical protein